MQILLLQRDGSGVSARSQSSDLPPTPHSTIDINTPTEPLENLSELVELRKANTPKTV